MSEKKSRQDIAIEDALNFEFDRIKEFGVSLHHQDTQSVWFNYQGLVWKVSKSRASIRNFLAKIVYL